MASIGEANSSLAGASSSFVDPTPDGVTFHGVGVATASASISPPPTRSIDIESTFVSPFSPSTSDFSAGSQSTSSPSPSSAGPSSAGPPTMGEEA
ncbi:hypothetical protein BV20DRAFT_1058295 [Pilatotrama ljubarskyi]|nr:hypothetical protein BV20DRAFT_1058295 [Pilatotrama ljubarskyi]